MRASGYQTLYLPLLVSAYGTPIQLLHQHDLSEYDVVRDDNGDLRQSSAAGLA